MQWLLALLTSIAQAIREYQANRQLTAKQDLFREIDKYEKIKKEASEGMEKIVHGHDPNIGDTFYKLQDQYKDACRRLCRLRQRLGEGTDSKTS